MPRTYINNWQKYSFKAGDIIQVRGSNESVEIIEHSRFRSGLAFRIDRTGDIFASASALVKYLLKKNNINSGWNYLTKGVIPDDSN